MTVVDDGHSAHGPQYDFDDKLVIAHTSLYAYVIIGRGATIAIMLCGPCGYTAYETVGFVWE